MDQRDEFSICVDCFSIRMSRNFTLHKRLAGNRAIGSKKKDRLNCFRSVCRGNGISRLGGALPGAASRFRRRRRLAGREREEWAEMRFPGFD